METYDQLGMPLRNVRDYLRRNWGWFLAVGIILTISGFLAIAYMAAATFVSVQIFGIILAAVGIVQIIEGFSIRKWNGVLMHVLIGILYLVTGAIMFSYPGMSAIYLTMMITGFLVIVGLFRIIASASLRYRQWGWTFLSGFITILAGIMLYLSLPFSGLWIIGLFVGIDLLFYGISMLAFAFAVRRKVPGREHSRFY